MEHWIVLLRHGHSEWNLADRFTGWTDIPLTQAGLSEAVEAAKQLSRAGYRFDEVHISRLKRTRQTADVVLSTLHTPALPVYATWRLNERHYGALQGMNKQAIFAAWGESAARLWWRGYATPPPPVSAGDPRHPCSDPLYADICPGVLPASESLADCQNRLLPYWRDILAPRVQAGRRMLVISHGNTLRALVMYLDHLSPEAMEGVEITPGVPLIYRFSADMQVLSRHWLN